MTKLKNTLSLSKNIFFSTKLLQAHLQYIRNISAKHWNDPMTVVRGGMHYQPLFTRCSCQKMAKLKTLSVCQKIFFQHQTSLCTSSIRAPAAQRQMRQMRKKISFGPTFFHLAQTFGAYFFRRHFYFFLCYKRYELRKRLMTPNKQCRWRVFLNWWWPLVIIGYKVRPIIDTYLVDWTWCLFN